MNEYYDDIYRILSNSWDEPGLEFFWCRDKSPTVQEVATKFAQDVEKKTAGAYEALGLIYWTYGNGCEDLEKARRIMTEVYMTSDEKQKKKTASYIKKIEEEVAKKSQKLFY